jgi:hypothetical protein
MNADQPFTYGQGYVFLVAFIFFLVVVSILVFLWLGWLLTSRRDSVSPYTGMPLRRGSDLSYGTMLKIYKYMEQYKTYDNKMFRVLRSAIDRETGRIFPNCVTWYGTIKVDWFFISKKCPGTYVSWGSLSREEQNEIINRHDSLEGFQTSYSCPRPLPSEITNDYIYTKPGPLYVDKHTGVLVGWKRIPDSDLEALIVQRPKPKMY